MLEGTNILDYSYESIRNTIGIVHQNISVFENTIRYNLDLGKSKIADYELWAVLKKVDLYEKIMSLPNKMNTVIGKKIPHYQVVRFNV